MAFVVSLRGFRPIPRYDDVPWTLARIQEAADAEGPWTQIEEITLSPVDADPAEPATRNLTSNAATLVEGYYRVVWLDAAANTSTSDVVWSEQPSTDGYPSASALVAASDVPELTSATIERQELMRTLSIAAVEGYTGQSFVERVGTRIIDGDGGSVLYLPERLAALTELAVPDGALELGDVVLSERRDRLHLAGAASSGSNYYSRTLRDLQGLDGVGSFPEGPGAIELTGTWGWLGSEYPSAISEALRLDMEDQALADDHQLANSLRAYHKLGIKWISQGELAVGTSSMERAGGQGAPFGRAPAISDRVAAILDPYVWVGEAGVLA